MSRLVLPPGMFPAPTGDGKVAVFPKSGIPTDLQPAPTGAGDDTTEALEALRCMAGAQAWPTPPQAPELPREAPTQPPAQDTAPPAAQEAQPPSVVPGPFSELVDGTTRYLYLTDVDDGTVATTADGQLLARTGEDGKPVLDVDGNAELIWVDADGYEVVPPALGDTKASKKEKGGRWSRLLNLAGTRGHSDTDDTPDVTYYDENGVPITGFDVTPIGAPPVNSARKSGKRLVYAAGLVMGTTTVMGLLFGLVVGSSRIPAEGAISADEAAAYRLTTFPVDAASAFAARYLEACLTHGDSAQLQDRQARLESMSAGTAPRDCGWQNDGAEQSVDSIVFNGYTDPAPGYETGEAAHLGFDVVLDGESLALSVPVWVGPTEGGGMAMQVVGTIGISPTIPVAEAPLPAQARNVDQELGATLSNTVVEPFLTAWAASDTRQMNLLMAREATTNVRSGLDGVLTKPNINTVVAKPTKPITAGETIVYEDGDVVFVDVMASWTVTASESTQQAGYRMSLVREADRWLVYDIQNGVVDASANNSSRAGTSRGTSRSGASRGNSGAADSSTRSGGTSTSGGTADGDSGGLGSVDDLQSGDDTSSGASGTSSPDSP